MGCNYRIVLPIVLALAGCGAGDVDETSETTAAVSTTNGIWENGLSTNGIWENGIWENGIWENGVLQNGIWENGIWENGFWSDDVWTTGTWLDGIWRNATWQTNSAARTILHENPYARQLLQYIYGCAMPAAAHRTLDAGYGVTVELQGAIGLWPTWDVCTGADCSAWNDAVATWRDGMPGTVPDGECNESCQRWVSACVLARTNAYGEHVQISMRPPEDAPTAIQNALATTEAETSAFNRREGAYYGNLFQTYPDASGRSINNPVLFACAGPASNIPDITRRFCSSQGASGVITNTGICQATEGRPGACADPTDPDPTESDQPTEHDCAAPMSGRVPATRYHEVITVYLQPPIATCGNSVCEEGESEGDDNECLTDCHPGSWARSFDTVPTEWGIGLRLTSTTGVSPLDNSVVVAGAVHGSVEVDYGGGPLAATGSDHWDLVIVKYDADGDYLWGRRIAQTDKVEPGAIAIDAAGLIAIAGDRPGALSDRLWVGKLASDGGTTEDWSHTFGGSASISVSGTAPTHRAGFAFGPGDSLVLAGAFGGTATFGDVTLAASDYDTFVIALSTDGSVTWARSLGGRHPGQMDLDGHGNVVLGVIADPAPDSHRLVKLDRYDGHEVWSHPLPTEIDNTIGVAADPATDAVYVTGQMYDPFDFGGGTLSDWGGLYLAKYDREGHHVWSRLSNSVLATPPQWAHVRGSHLAIGPNDDVILNGDFETHNGARADFGGGQLDSYSIFDQMVVSYSRADGRTRWSKHIPQVLFGIGHSLRVDSRGHIVLAGKFAGSMLVDDHLLVDGIPELPTHVNVFLASFPPPGLDAPDITPPTIGPAPGPFYVHATSPAGARVWYMPPTATDIDHAGVSVFCDPAPDSMFPLGTTTVACTATDPFGHTDSTSFPVTVGDDLGPIFLVTPVNASATSSSGATVNYPLPTASDQVSGPTAVTCMPASGSTFPLGTTLVTCTSTDGAANTTTRTFPVTVKDTTPPELTIPPGLTVPATSSAGAVVSYSAYAYDAVDDQLPITCTPPPGSTFPLGTTIVTCSATDGAGNTASRQFPVTVVDTTPPVPTVPLTLTVPATTSSGAKVTYSASAHDAVDGAVPITCKPQSGSVFSLGNTIVRCSASDAAGNEVQAKFVVRVQAKWSGILQPVNSDGSSIYRSKSTIPLRFALEGASANITNLTAKLSFSQKSSTISGTVLEKSILTAPDSGYVFHYDASTHQYVYNLPAKLFAKGDWLLSIDMNDGVARTVKVSILE